MQSTIQRRDLRLLLMGKYFRLPGERFDAEPVASMLTRALDADDVVFQTRPRSWPARPR